MNTTKAKLHNLLITIRKLRDKDGCPWDKRQTAESLRKYLKEEVNELIRAIENNDADNICEECGDIIYLIIMISEINREKKKFRFSDVIQCIDEKLIRRHPHVFAGQPYESEDELSRQWQRIKAEEKKKKSV
ncbi:MAG: nucleotide pyrophosphohydrolase [Deltaproteobacteria bacterium]|nr:nucleotide pyrophosphohydrolase [Deltaproteobacteria bacterium]MBW2658570.1 nucleotide pyrophosphohydrolase [Deltaproteobacteria bacterium]